MFTFIKIKLTNQVNLILPFLNMVHLNFRYSPSLFTVTVAPPPCSAWKNVELVSCFLIFSLPFFISWSVSLHYGNFLQFLLIAY